MFVGHFAVAFLLARLFPSVPFFVALAGVSFPDLLWSVLIFSHIEKVKVNPNSPLQKYLIFTKYPFSHSLVLTNILASIVGVILSLILNDLYVAFVFVLGSASHWMLDTIVHLKDLPVLGFGAKDRKIGVGLWNHGTLAFAVEYVFYAAVTVLAVPLGLIPIALLLGAAFHLLNANSFFGFTKNNPFDSSSNVYAAVTLAGFVLFSLFASNLI